MPVSERRLAEVGAADEGGAGAVLAVEDVGLGVEGHGRGGKAGPGGRGCDGGLEDADVAVAVEVEELREGVGVGEAEVVAGDEPEAASFAEEVAEVLLDAGNTALA
jgi:hypothetical protein